MARPESSYAELPKPSRDGCKALPINYTSQVGPARIARRSSACHVVK